MDSTGLRFARDGRAVEVGLLRLLVVPPGFVNPFLPRISRDGEKW